MKRLVIYLSSCYVLIFAAPAAFAGMPKVLPEDYMQRFQRLNDTALHRLQAISFFAAVFLGCAATVRWLWNRVQRDLPALPRLSMLGSISVVFLWGLLFVIVLTMISGARELMTPGAWKPQGFTYKLAANEPPSPASSSSNEANRRRHLEQLRTALLTFAATHEGKFPGSGEVTAIASDLWEIPGSGSMRYLYVPGLKAWYLAEVLAYEPELEPDQRLVLKTNGDILMMRSTDIQSVLVKRGQP